MTDTNKNIAFKVDPEKHKQIKRLSVDTEKSIKTLLLECFDRLVKEYEEKRNEYER